MTCRIMNLIHLKIYDGSRGDIGQHGLILAGLTILVATGDAPHQWYSEMNADSVILTSQSSHDL